MACTGVHQASDDGCSALSTFLSSRLCTSHLLNIGEDHDSGHLDKHGLEKNQWLKAHKRSEQVVTVVGLEYYSVIGHDWVSGLIRVRCGICSPRSGNYINMLCNKKESKKVKNNTNKAINQAPQEDRG